jgi:uncharacterized protein (DUF2336 family)
MSSLDGSLIISHRGEMMQDGLSGGDRDGSREREGDGGGDATAKSLGASFETTATPLDEERARVMALSADPLVRQALARRPDAPPDALFYLARDQDTAVRRAVAHHDATPVQAAPRLARDSDTDVKALLARRLARLFPSLAADDRLALREIALEAMMRLALDQSIRVRAALASALSDIACAPPHLAALLGRDTAREVAEPILRLCANAPDDDLIAIIAVNRSEWVLQAIAQRQRVSPSVSDAVIASGDRAATTALLANPGAQLSESGLKHLTDRALSGAQGGGAPLLSQGLRDQLATIVDQSAATALAPQGFDREDRRDVMVAAQRRLEWARDYVRREKPDAKAWRFYEAGDLTEERIGDALSWGDKAFAYAALALRARLPQETVERVIAVQSARAITALAWRAGLSMRCARLLQLKAGLHPSKLLNARNGADYPMSEDDMAWHLALFGIE